MSTTNKKKLSLYVKKKKMKTIIINNINWGKRIDIFTFLKWRSIAVTRYVVVVVALQTVVVRVVRVVMDIARK